MINRAALLSDLQSVLRKLETDLLDRSAAAEVPEVGLALRAEFETARKAQRTAQNFEEWRSDAITQVAAAWVLSLVFVRFLEDNELIDPPKLAGPGARLDHARDEQTLFFQAQERAGLTDREYLLDVFAGLRDLKGGAAKDIFGGHNPVWELPNWLGADAARDLLKFFQKIDANTGTLVHDFTDPNWDTRFLGDLYQDLSEAARKKYALLQTPEFVEEFILDRTLDPALDEFGLVVNPAVSDPQPRQPFKLIDPACGSGHFLLGAFPRILSRWQKQEPGEKISVLAQRTLDSIHGVDVNPYAVAIARFRLFLAAMRACEVTRLIDAPAFQMNLVCGDSLLHAPLASGGKKYTAGQQELDFALTNDPDDSDECDHAYRSENLSDLKRMLGGAQYHVVVANPPYITPKDPQLNERYRRRFRSCHKQYSLAVPFMERIFRLAVPCGFTGQITANTFMKAEFGKKLIESFVPTVDLTHVIDTSGAYIPGHGTPTVILFGRSRPPVASTLRTVMGIRGEPSTPTDPARGLAWSAIVAQVDEPGSQSEFVSAGDSTRELFHKHPWSIGGGGACELKELLEAGRSKLDTVVEAIGRTTVVGEDDAWIVDHSTGRRRGLGKYVISFCVGDGVRDWSMIDLPDVIYPYRTLGGEAVGTSDERLLRDLWPSRATLSARTVFGKSLSDMGRPWWEHLEHYRDKLRTPLSIAYAFVATHNHFVLDRGGKVFKQTAPVIKLSRDATEDDHLALLGLLNTSTASFWLKQVCFPKGGDHVGQEGARVRRTAWDERYNYNSTPMASFPLPTLRPLITTKLMNSLAASAAAFRPASVAANGVPTRRALDMAKIGGQIARSQMIAAQEELDWECYRDYGLIDSPMTRTVGNVSGSPGQSLEVTALSAFVGLELGQRAFEIVMARKMSAGKLQTTWFERHGSTPITELPAAWPDDYRQLVERRIAMIEDDPNIRLIEQPEYKRRWNTESWESQLERALREWLLNRLESYFDFDGRMNDSKQPTAKVDIALAPIARLADVARQDTEFQQVGELYRNDTAFDVQKLVEELVAAECVPLLPILRYKPSGLIKRSTWERTWDLQRQEDTIDARTKLPATDPQYLSESLAKDLKQQQVGDIPVPTKYDSKDFLDSNLWRLRGKLDVPKERWISFPHCEGEDGTLMLAWAGYDHLQQARAISAHYVDIQERLGGRDDPRLIPLLACLIELLPWLKQWHNDPDPAFDGMRMGDYFEGFVHEEARSLPKRTTNEAGEEIITTGWTIADIKAWKPTPRTTGKGRKKASK